MNKKIPKFAHTIKFKISVAFIATIIAIMFIFNTYPISATRNLICGNKEDDLLSKAYMIAGVIEEQSTAQEQSVMEILEILGISQEIRVIVTDDTGLVTFDGAYAIDTKGQYILISEVVSALNGKSTANSKFNGQAFESSASVPIKAFGTVTGAVYLYEKDIEQAEILFASQSDAQNLSIVIAIIVSALVITTSNHFGTRINRLFSAMSKIGAGDYTHRVEVEAKDEISDMARAFNNLTAKLEDNENMRREFVANASHELRTPLASIKLLADSIVQTSDIKVDEVRDFLGDITDEIDRLTRITDRLITLTRLDVTKDVKKTADLLAVANKVISVLESVCLERGLELGIGMCDNVIVYAEADGLHQILFNLIENAIKYNKVDGKVNISISKDDRFAIINVEDNGIGIDSKDKDKIFERFYRVDKARARGTGGTGLGLSIVKSWVDLYKGEITVHSVPEQGTRFCVKLPLAMEEKDAK